MSNGVIDISEIRAEVLLNYLYPEMAGEWIARCEGSFYRNYSDDLMSLFEDREVVLSRDGLLKLLPDGLISDESELTGNVADNYQKLTARIKLLKEAFLPIDTFFFRQKLNIEQKTSELLKEKLSFLLKKYWGYDIAAENNRYVKEVAVLLPYVSRLRADLGSIGRLLGDIVGCPAEMKLGRYSEEDSTRWWLPKVEYQLLIPELTPEEYTNLREEIVPLQQFVAEWLIPVEMKCEINIRWREKRPQRAMLDYNVKVKGER